ncbi:MAG: hybrid sensor histidine kinase/response regulator [Burkholderiaceae bacterium]|nr:hybrid sensor histidine kinase/response regulator [Burkholderiaceae bacterium]
MSTGPLHPLSRRLDAEAERAFRQDYEASGLPYLLAMARVVQAAALVATLGIAAMARGPMVLALSSLAVALALELWRRVISSARPVRHHRAAVTLFAATFVLAATVLLLNPLGPAGGPILLTSMLTLIAFFSFGATGLSPLFTTGTVGAGALALLATHAWMQPGAMVENPDLLLSGVAAIMCAGGYFKQHTIERRARSLFAGAQDLAAAQGRTEELLRQADELRLRAQHESAERARFLSAVSHDVRQPLTALGLRITLLRERLEHVDEATQEQFEALAQAIESLADTLSATLNLSLLQSRNADWPVEPVNLALLLREVHAAFEPTARQAGVLFSLRLPAGEDECWTLTHREQLKRTITNLVTNAIKYQRPAGARNSGRRRFVLLALARGGENLKVHVVDNGLGIEQSYLERIFEPYFQIENPERNASRGVGLGLANVSAALRWLPGHAIRVASMLGMGSRFTVSLPRAEAPWFAYHDAALLPNEVNLAGTVIAVLEDNNQARAAFTDRLRAWGAHVQSAARLGEMQAIIDAAERFPDLIITDYQLPYETDGLGAIAQLREIVGWRLPAILISGHDLVEDPAYRVTMPERTTFLAKPVSSEALGQAVTEALSSYPAEADESGAVAGPISS